MLTEAKIRRAHRVVTFERKAPLRTTSPDRLVAKVFPPEAREALIAASKTEPKFRIRNIARVVQRLKSQYPHLFRMETFA